MHRSHTLLPTDRVMQYSRMCLLGTDCSETSIRTTRPFHPFAVLGSETLNTLCRSCTGRQNRTFQTDSFELCRPLHIFVYSGLSSTIHLAGRLEHSMTPRLCYLFVERKDSPHHPREECLRKIEDPRTLILSKIELLKVCWIRAEYNDWSPHLRCRMKRSSNPSTFGIDLDIVWDLHLLRVIVCSLLQILNTLRWLSNKRSRILAKERPIILWRSAPCCWRNVCCNRTSVSFISSPLV